MAPHGRLCVPIEASTGRQRNQHGGFIAVGARHRSMMLGARRRVVAVTADGGGGEDASVVRNPCVT
jgi:hypothetical protein